MAATSHNQALLCRYDLLMVLNEGMRHRSQNDAYRQLARSHNQLQ